MGADKAFLEVDGVALAQRVANALTAGGVESVSRIDAAQDRWPGEGPLGGLTTAVLAAEQGGAAIVVVAGCDHPDLDPSLVNELVEALADAASDVIASVPVTPDGRRQPFPSAWRTTAGPQLEALFGTGERRAGAAFGVGVVLDVAAAWEQLADLDTPEELEARRTGASAEGEPSP